ncbi:S1 RNA-binding domain-containing protein, partial [Enterococcus faecalis]|uniref:S1 RNA-binding domain-containing protein n=1 Tax=Enterococcus faecalis TaxID=1351 RepID=UPI003D6BA80C
TEGGANLPGKVSGITIFGAFIYLGEGKTGLVHNPAVSNGFDKDIHDVLTEGDVVTEKVTPVDDDGKIGLSFRKGQEPAECQQPTLL